LLVDIHDHSGFEAAMQLHALGLHVVQLLAQAVEFLLVRLGVESANDGMGLAVEGRARDTAVGSLLGNGPVRTVENDGGAGQSRGQR
jgi:hypothetical protein